MLSLKTSSNSKEKSIPKELFKTRDHDEIINEFREHGKPRSHFVAIPAPPEWPVSSSLSQSPVPFPASTAKTSLSLQSTVLPIATTKHLFGDNSSNGSSAENSDPSPLDTANNSEPLKASATLPEKVTTRVTRSASASGAGSKLPRSRSAFKEVQ